MTAGPWVDRAYVGILPDFSKFSREAEAGISRNLNNLQRDADRVADRIDHRYERLGRDLRRHLDFSRDLDLDVGLNLDLGDTSPEITPRVDDSQIRRARDSARSLRDELLRAGATVGALGRLGRPALFAGIIAAVPAAFSLASALSTVAGLAATAPAGLAAIGVAAGAVGLGFSGVSDAVEALNKSLDGTEASAKKAAEAMRNLSPAGREFARFLFSLRDEFTSLRNTAQAGLLPGVETGIRRLLPLLPTLERSLGGVARALGGLAAEAGERFARRGEDLRRIFATNTLLVKAFGEAGLDLAEVFIDIGAAAGPLVRWVADLARGWAETARETVAAARASGSLARGLQTTRATLERVFSITGNVIGIFGDLGRVAFPSGAGLLASLDAATEKLHDFTTNLRQGGGMAGAVRAWIGSIADAVREGNWGRVTREVYTGLTGAVKAAAERSSSAVVDGLARGLDTGDWGPLGDAIGRRMAELPLMISNAIRTKVDWRQVGQDAAHALVPFALGLAGGLFDAIVDAFREDFWGTLFDVIMIVPIGRVAGTLLRVVPALVRVPLLGGLLRAFEGVGRLIETPLRAIGGRILSGLREGLERVFPRLAPIIRSGFRGLLSRILDWVRDFRTAGGNLIQGLATGIAEQIGLVVRNIAQVVRTLLRPFVGIGRWLVRQGGDLLRGLLTGMRGFYDDISRGIRITIGRLLDPFRGISRWLVREGGDLLRGLASGIRSLWGSLSSTILSTIRRITGAFAGAARWLIEEGRQILQGLLVGVLRRIGEVGGLGGWFKTHLVDPIVNAVRRFFKLGSPSRVFEDIGTNLVAGLFRGVLKSDPVGTIKGIFGGMPQALNAIVGKGLINLASLPQSILSKVFGFLGGLIGGTSGSWHRAIQELISDHVAYSVVSAFRPGAVTHASGRQSYHALNRAVDLVGPDMLAIWQSLLDTNPTELIYSHAPFYVAGGRAKPIGQLDRITYADHLRHVHVAYDTGGYLKPGFTPSLNFTGQPERVLDPTETRIWESLERVARTRTTPTRTPAATVPAEPRPVSLDLASVQAVGRATADALLRAGIGAVNIDSRRVEQVLAGAALANGRRA
jgi:hypothetical protein